MKNSIEFIVMEAGGNNLQSSPGEYEAVKIRCMDYIICSSERGTFMMPLHTILQLANLVSPLYSLRNFLRLI